MPTKIDWCDETINPLGHWCFGPGGTRDKPQVCAYCYAARMAKRGLFTCPKCKTFCEPHTHFEQLEKLAKWEKPRAVFVQSMGDLFHPAVPDEWIKEVFDACEKSPQHHYLFLTKSPDRYLKLAAANALPKRNNHWYGMTVTSPDQYAYYVGTHQTFLSIEPIAAQFDPALLAWGCASWVIVGMETGNRKDKVIPKREWIKKIVNGCRDYGIPVFLKDNLADIWGEPLIQEFPWEVE